MRYESLIMPADAVLREGLSSQSSAARGLLAQGAERRGWKAGFGTTAAKEKLRTTGPLAGFPTDSTLLPSDSVIEIEGWVKPVLEPEVAVRLGSDVAAGASHAEVAAAIDAVGAAIELVDLGEAGDDAGEILAANIFHRWFLLGELVEIGGGLDQVRIDVHPAGQAPIEAADPADVLGDLVDVVRGMADLLGLGDERLQAGDVIITGAAIPPFALQGGEAVEVRVAASTVAARIA